MTSDTRRNTSFYGELKNADDNRDMPLSWLQRHNVHKQYVRQYQDGMDVPGLHFERASERLRNGVNLAIEKTIADNIHPENRFSAPNRIPKRQQAINMEHELMTQREVHDPDCIFEMPDLTGIPLTAREHPDMPDDTLAALMQSQAYQTIIDVSHELTNARSNESWTVGEFEQWLEERFDLPAVVHRDQKGPFKRLVYRLDIGWRFFVIWMLPIDRSDQNRVLKKAAVFFFCCKCRRGEENK